MSGSRDAVTASHPGLRRIYKDEASDLLNVEQDFGCVNVRDHDGERFILRLLSFTSCDPLKAGLRLPAVKLLAGLIGAQLGVEKDERR